MKHYCGDDIENLEENNDILGKEPTYRQWKTSLELIEERRDSFDGFNFEYELNRISEAYQIKDLHFLNTELSSSPSNTIFLDYQKYTKNTNEKSSQIKNSIFRLVYPPICDDGTKKVDQRVNNSQIFISSQDTNSNISPSKSFYNIDKVTLIEPISEVIRRINEYSPPREFVNNEKKKTDSKASSNVFKIDDKLYFVQENNDKHNSSSDKRLLRALRKVHKKREGKLKSIKKREKIENFNATIKIPLNNITKVRNLNPLKKSIKKVKKNITEKSKWGYIKNDFFYYESKKPSFGNSSEKDHFLIKIPLQVIKSQ